VRLSHQHPSDHSVIALHLMVRQLSVNTQETAIKNRNRIYNEINTQLNVNADGKLMSAFFDTVLQTLNNLARDTVFRISAKTYPSVTIVHIKGNTEYNHPAFYANITKLRHLAEKIGIAFEVTSFRNNISTVALSFLNFANSPRSSR
jgi:hypothetical protein